MANDLDNLSLDDIVAMTPGLCKFTLIKLLFPTTSDQKAGRLAGYSGECGGQLKKRVAGALGGHLEKHGITMETVAERLSAAMNAQKMQVVILKNHKSDGEPRNKRKVRIVQTAELIEAGPDWNTQLKAAQFITVCHAQGEKEEIKVPELPPPNPDIPQDDLEELVGRGPQPVQDAEFEEVDVETG